jgi:glycosyltransferase involved in cell wall biosynthesis
MLNSDGNPPSAASQLTMTPDVPAVTIVTPCLNAAQFLEYTLQSVLQQDYPNFEFLVIDGGSTDGTIALLERYAAAYPDKMRYVSEPDSGASEAIAKGFQMARGDIFAYLNADDTYFPGAIGMAVSHLADEPAVAGIYGKACWIDKDGSLLGAYPTKAFDAALLGRECFICQPACFVRAAAIRAVGGFDLSLHSAFDYDLWLRLAQRYTLLQIDVLLANSRMHAGNKTLSGRETVFREAIGCVRRHQGYVPFQWIHGYSSFLLDRRDQFFEPLLPSFPKYLVSLAMGLWVNWRHPVRFAREWCGVMSPAAFVRRWNASWIARRTGMQIR